MGKGYINRKVLVRISKRLDRRKWRGNFLFYMCWWGVNVILNATSVIGDTTEDKLFWGFLILLFLDDYLNKDDNLRKFFKEVKNKVKWLMQLPPEPLGVRDAA